MAKRTSVVDKAYEYILNEIISARFPPGFPVIGQDIAEKLNISRTPVREAITRLESEGLLTSLPYQGTLVATLSTEDIREICDLRMMIELWALNKGAHLISDEELDQIETLFNEAVSPFCPRKYHEADKALHKLIVDKARSTRLNDMLHKLDIQVMRFREASAESSRRFKKSYEEHMQIIQDIRDRDFDKCAFDLERHLKSVTEGFVVALKESKFTV